MIARAFERLWWQRERGLFAILLQPFAYGFRCVSSLRRWWLVKQQAAFSVPVVVVGNLSVGGNGKTPMIISLANRLKEHGFCPGIVSRGYGGIAPFYPMPVLADSKVTEVGDEPLLIVRKTGLPMVVSPKRVEAVQMLIEHYGCDLVLSDDGLQHYRMHRDLELVLISKESGLGNQQLLPAGPLREPLSRLQSVDFVLSAESSLLAKKGYTLKFKGFYYLDSGEAVTLECLRLQPLVAITAIAKPVRFFHLLRSMELSFEERCFNDHHFFSEEDLMVKDGYVVVTEKDAVKCHNFAKNVIVAAIDFVIEPSFWQDFIIKLENVRKKRV